MGKLADSLLIADLPVDRSAFQEGGDAARRDTWLCRVVRAVNVYVRQNLTKTLRRRENV
jgi:hypothetical protein